MILNKLRLKHTRVPKVSEWLPSWLLSRVGHIVLLIHKSLVVERRQILVAPTHIDPVFHPINLLSRLEHPVSRLSNHLQRVHPAVGGQIVLH